MKSNKSSSQISLSQIFGSSKKEIPAQGPVDAESLLESSAEKGQLYALIDPFFHLPFDLPVYPLNIRDTDTELYEMIAWDKVFYQPPYLVPVNLETLKWIHWTLSTERWGVFVVCSSDMNTLGRHLQKFVITRGPENTPYFLRFHDAAVLETLFQKWDEYTRHLFMGPIENIIIPSLDDLEFHLLKLPQANEINKVSEKKPEDCLLILTQDQLQACAEAIEKDLIRLIYWHLRSYHGRVVQYLDRHVLFDRIEMGLRCARSYELSGISDLAGYVALMFELTPNFDQHPSFARVLLDPRLAPEQKMRKLSHVITDEEWREAKSFYERNSWSELKKRVA